MASVKGKLEKKNNSSSNELTNTLILGLVGLILLLIPDTLNKLLGIVVGLGLLILGIYSIYQYLQQKLFTSNMISGILYSILGLIVLLYPGSVIRAVAIGIGFALIVIGLSKLRQALIKDKRFKELYLLPAAQTRDKSAVNEEQMKNLTDKLKEEFDYILIDCPAGIEQGFKNAIAGADRAIVVTTAEISAIRDADRIIGLLESSEIKNPELVINRIRPNMVRKGEMMDVDDIVDLLSIDLIGVVPDDEYIITQTNKGEPVIQNKKAPSGKAYIEIAKRVLGEKIEITIPGREKGFWARLKRFFKK